MLKTTKLLQRTIGQHGLAPLSLALPFLHKSQAVTKTSHHFLQHSKRYFNEEIRKQIEEHYYKNHTPIMAETVTNFVDQKH